MQVILLIVNHNCCGIHNVCCKQANGLIFTILSLDFDNNCTDRDICLVGGSTSSQEIYSRDVFRRSLWIYLSG